MRFSAPAAAKRVPCQAQKGIVLCSSSTYTNHPAMASFVLSRISEDRECLRGEGVSVMEKMLQVEKPYHTEGDYSTFIKKAPALLDKYLQVVLCELPLLAGGIGGLVLVGILILTVLFTVFAVGAFVNYGFGYFF